MVNVTVFLVLLGAVAIIGEPPQCSKEPKGDVTGQGISLLPAYLSPGIRDWNVQIPYIPQCPYGLKGLEVVACDNDVAPTSTIISFQLVYVHRNGNLQGTGVVHITVFCA